MTDQERVGAARAILKAALEAVDALNVKVLVTDRAGRRLVAEIGVARELELDELELVPGALPSRQETTPACVRVELADGREFFWAANLTRAEFGDLAPGDRFFWFDNLGVHPLGTGVNFFVVTAVGEGHVECERA